MAMDNTDATGAIANRSADAVGAGLEGTRRTDLLLSNRCLLVVDEEEFVVLMAFTCDD